MNKTRPSRENKRVFFMYLGFFIERYTEGITKKKQVETNKPALKIKVRIAAIIGHKNISIWSLLISLFFMRACGYFGYLNVSAVKLK
jgi:hypothetical protein